MAALAPRAQPESFDPTSQLNNTVTDLLHGETLGAHNRQFEHDEASAIII